MPENLQIVLAERPKDEIIPGKTFNQKTVPAPEEKDLKDGQILVEALYLSLDPAMRGWLNDSRSYLPPVEIGAIMRGAVVCRVLASKDPAVARDAIVTGFLGWQERGILSPGMFTPPADMPQTSQPTDMLGVLGTTGLTAYFGITKVAGTPREGETVVVSGAAGATGSVVGQIAKIGGARVVGIAGSDDKCKWLTDDLGFDVALNYKDPDFKKKFAEATPKYIDVYFDNVGGEILDLCLSRANKNARFAICGAISQYNTSKPYGNRALSNVITQRIRMQGFIVMDFMAEYGAARKQLAEWLEAGKIKRRETVVKGGLKAAEQALVDLYKGVNTGKLIVEIKNPEDGPKL